MDQSFKYAVLSKYFQSEIDAGIASASLFEVTVDSTNINSQTHTIWMNFDPNAGGPIILNTNDDTHGCPIVYAENDAVFEGCLDKITLPSGKKIHVGPKPQGWLA